MPIKKKNKKLKVHKNAKQIRHLETDLKFTLKALDGRNGGTDSIFLSQADRIRTEIQKLKENQ